MMQVVLQYEIESTAGEMQMFKEHVYMRVL